MYQYLYGRTQGNTRSDTRHGNTLPAQLVSEVGKSKASFIAADEEKLAAWTAQINAAKTSLADRQQTMQARITAILAIIQKTQFLENVLANSMAPGMAAALDWSRGVSARGLN